MLLSGCYAPSQLGVLRQLSPCVECLSFGQPGSFPTIPETPGARPRWPPWSDLKSPLPFLCFLTSHISLCPSRLSWAWRVAGTQETFVEWINWKWSPGGRMKKSLGESAIGWIGTLGRWAKCYLTTSALEHPWLWTYFCLLNGFIPLRTWLQIQMTPLYSCVVLGAYLFLFLLLSFIFIFYFFFNLYLFILIGG